MVQIYRICAGKRRNHVRSAQHHLDIIADHEHFRYEAQPFALDFVLQGSLGMVNIQVAVLG